ncbi:response regulator [Hyunsoonleella sp. SJ7]|uniref:histidine kinase n=1 Tax=Hyunsoonleella aquatilis TaxID=2762758 RepID=A0A923HC26_9FLAO|nr:response regulator [Hyunsoonleella aquatilis]MBC3758624.1 response regulator [Hyunsoonleella aquatilis]
MTFPPKTKKEFKVLAIASALGIVLLGVLFFVGTKLISDDYYLVTFSLLLFVLLVFTVLVLLYNLRSQIEGDVVESYLNNRINELELELQKALETSEHKSIYLANMSHEIRIPLSTILGMIRMLKNTDLDLDQRAQVEIAEYSSEHLLQLINMILNNSKGIEGHLELEQATIDIESDLSKLLKIFEYQAWEKGLEFEYNFAGEEKPKFLLLGDLGKIQQVLINLVNNAIKFTHSGKIAVTIDHTVTHDDHQVVTFYIKDTGVGMKRHEVEHAFSTLEERDIMPLQHYRGSGIGLAVTKKLVELMGGELKLESKENEGSTFYFSLQLKKTLNLKQELPEETPILLNKFDYRFNVLVAEDNKMNQKVIKFLLEQQGAECTFVTNGLDAVNLYKVIDFDMIFMDIYMPKMNGYEATKIIKNSDKFAKHKIPIIAVSASAFEEDIENAKASGVDEFLAKPIDNQKLRNLLKRYALEKENVS